MNFHGMVSYIHNHNKVSTLDAEENAERLKRWGTGTLFEFKLLSSGLLCFPGKCSLGQMVR